MLAPVGAVAGCATTSVAPEAHAPASRPGTVESEPAGRIRTLNAATIKRLQGHRFAEALVDAEAAADLALTALPPGDPLLADTLFFVGVIYTSVGRTADGIAVLTRVAELKNAADDRGFGPVLMLLGVAYMLDGQLLTAKEALTLAVARLERDFGRDHAAVASAYGSLAQVLSQLREFDDAERVGRHALALSARTADTPDALAGPALALAAVLRAQGRYDEGIALIGEVLGRIVLKSPEHPTVANLNMVLSGLYVASHRSDDAKRVLRGFFTETGHAGSQTPLIVASAGLQLVELNRSDGDLEAARRLGVSVLELTERIRSRSLEAAASVQLARVLLDLRRPSEAEAHLRRALAIRDDIFGPSSVESAEVAAWLVRSLIDQGRWQAARPLAERARHTLSEIARSYADLGDEHLRGLARLSRDHLEAYLADLITAAGAIPGATGRLALEDSFSVADQLHLTVAHLALAKAAAAAAPDDGRLRELRRKAATLRNRRQLLGERARNGEVPSDETLARLDKEIGAITGEIGSLTPRSADVVAIPLTPSAEVAAVLSDREALVSMYVLGDRVITWVVKRTGPPAYGVSTISREAVADLVRRMRHGIDHAGHDALTTDTLRPVDLDAAAALYRLLFAPVERDLQDVETLVIVPDERLLPIPFAALVRSTSGPYAELARLAPDPVLDASAARRYRDIDWLVTRWATAIVPSAAAFVALRRKPPAAEPVTAFIGIGDPQLAGAAGRRRGASLSGQDPSQVAEAIRRLGALPGARGELDRAAALFGVDETANVFSGVRASKNVVRALNESGRLGGAHIVMFATHGVTAGGARGFVEPGLVLTPPTEPSEADYGLLTLTDILGLNFDRTRWVILAACDTAAPDASGEGLSGLVRAFLFAGAPTVMVTHWAVEDRSTERLDSELFTLLRSRAAGSKAEAVRKAMLNVMSTTEPGLGYFSHPFAWAPFFLVGESR
jgi:CHAT domain-containing protein/tetratricopeptide (TPR) repeat protein